MIEVLVIAAASFCLGWKLRKTYVPDERDDGPKLLPAGESDADKLEEWKQVFRDTVVSVEGGISPAMEQFLAGPPETPALDVTTQAFRTRMQIEGAKIVKPYKVKPKRKPMDKGTLKIFLYDLDTADFASERLNIVKRYHRKGYLFSPEARKIMLDAADFASERTAYRDIFDEQDGEV